jgi:uncharacterized protein (TIGR03083 family)
MDTVAWHRRSVERFVELTEGVQDDQWGLPTPCAEWDVRAFVNHLAYEDKWTVPLMAGKTIEEVGDQFEGDLLGGDPRRPWQRPAKRRSRRSANRAH